MSQSSTLFIGMDVHKDTIAVAYVGPNPTLTLVANSYAAFRAAKGEQRVFAGGVPANHSPILTILRAAAVAICCKWGLASPIYRDCRRPHRRIPCAWVPSRPARGAYCCANAAVVWRWRAACSASYCSCAWSPTIRGSFFARVHWARCGQGVQSLRTKRASHVMPFWG